MVKGRSKFVAYHVGQRGRIELRKLVVVHVAGGDLEAGGREEKTGKASAFSDKLTIGAVETI